jgi:predicted nucleic acid-binding protein
LLNDLDLGEAQTIVLAKELNANMVLIDENIGYKIAKSQNLNVKRTLSLLIAAKNKKYITTIKPLLDDMITNKRWISKSVYFEVLKICKEL